jgi:V/A-type H+/Na+-transporting ATPase subunit I
MFRPERMVRLSLLVLEQDERAVLQHLGRAGIMQLMRTPAAADTAPLPSRDRSAEMARCDRLLAQVENLCRSLELKSPSEEMMTLPNQSLDWAERKLGRLEEQAGDLIRRRQGVKQHFDNVTETNKVMSAYRGLHVPLDNPDEFSFLHFVTGRLPVGNIEKLEVGDNAAVLALPEQTGWQPVVVMATHPRWTGLEAELKRAGFQKQSFPVVEGANLDDFSDKQEGDQTKLSAGLDELNLKLKTFAKESRQTLADVKSVISMERRLCEAEQNFPRTEKAVLFAGWIPDTDAAALELRLIEITGGRCVCRTSTPKKSRGEPAPILLRHPWPFRPFEMLVSAYGLPEYWDLEPTVFVALSYLLMFGMMFGDVGHGAILATLGLIGLLAAKRKIIRDAGLLLLFSGCASITFGAIYGSCFGIPSLKKYALWHDPLEGDTMRLMTGSIAIGIVLISLGLVLNVVNRFRRGDAVGGCFDKFGLAGLLFYWGSLALAAKWAVFHSRGLAPVACILFLALPVISWVLKEPIRHFRGRGSGQRLEPNRDLLAAITESMVEVFEGIISYFSNTISFVRLAAYCMSHTALLMATFTVAASVRELPHGGGALSLLVIVLGNLLALALEGIVASVQALRLEYYEFFGKFFSGAGHPFRPFRLIGEQQTATG